MVRHTAIVLSLLTFAVALFLPAFSLVRVGSGERIEMWFGWMALLLGWFGALVGSVAWLANPAFVLGLSLVRARKAVSARLVLMIAWALGMSTIVQVLVPFVGDEAGVTRSLLQPQIGCFVWLASLTTAAIAAWLPVPAATSALEAESSPARQVLALISDRESSPHAT